MSYLTESQTNPSGFILPNQTGIFAIQSSVVLNTGNQTISGNKTFAGNIVGGAGLLIDNGGNTVIDWNNNLLQKSFITTLNWGNQTLMDSGSIRAISWSSRIAYDSSFNPSIDWTNRVLSGNWNIQNLNISGNSITTGGPYYSSNNPSGYITTGQTGVFYSSNNPSGYVASSQTGSFLSNSFYRAGTVTIGSNSTTQAVSFSSNFTGVNYSIGLTPDNAMASANSFAATNKTISGFTISVTLGVLGGFNIDYIALLNK